MLAVRALLVAGLPLLAACNAREWNEAREQELLAEIEASPEHDWAGEYRSTYLMNCWCSLVVSPQGDFTYHESCCLVTGERDGGDARFDGAELHLEPDADMDPSLRFSRHLRLVRWGTERFLVPTDKMGSFVSWINNCGHSPFFGWRSGFLRRWQGTAQPLVGRPELPEPWSERFLDEPLELVCVGVERGREQHGGHSVEVELDAGPADGLWPDMVLWANALQQRAIVSRIEGEHWIAQVRVRREDQPDEELLGAVFSTRLD